MTRGAARKSTSADHLLSDALDIGVSVPALAGVEHTQLARGGWVLENEERKG